MTEQPKITPATARRAMEAGYAASKPKTPHRGAHETTTDRDPTAGSLTPNLRLTAAYTNEENR